MRPEVCWEGPILFNIWQSKAKLFDEKNNTRTSLMDVCFGINRRCQGEVEEIVEICLKENPGINIPL